MSNEYLEDLEGAIDRLGLKGKIDAEIKAHDDRWRRYTDLEDKKDDLEAEYEELNPESKKALKILDTLDKIETEMIGLGF